MKLYNKFSVLMEEIYDMLTSLSKACFVKFHKQKINTMKTVKKLGIWMDHSIAYLMEFTNSPFEIKTIESNFSVEEKELQLSKAPALLINEEKHILHEYYNKIGDAIKNYKQIVLFGPSDAKVEFFDVLSEDERFLKIKFEIKETDKMSMHQQHDFILEYFANK
ncbi:MAG: hypothetical protein ACI9WT_000291 [Flavobacterium sp.]|jgi:hypothetical protein